MPPLRVGSVPYLVARPLDAGLDDHPEIALERQVPARLVERLRDGELDVALVSSIELFRREGYRWIEGPVVAGRGIVSSVQVFHRRPMTEVKRIALDPSSRATATLVRVLIAAERGRDAVEFVEVELDEDPSQVDADGWLRIGDTAMRELLRTGGPPAWNPAEAWTLQTCLPFVFAVWIVRPGVELTPEHLAAFAASARRDEVRIEQWAREAAREWDVPFEPCRRYLAEECLYDPGAEARASLAVFRDRAAALDLCDGSLDPQPIRIGDAHAQDPGHQGMSGLRG